MFAYTTIKSNITERLVNSNSARRSSSLMEANILLLSMLPTQHNILYTSIVFMLVTILPICSSRDIVVELDALHGVEMIQYLLLVVMMV